MTRGRSVSKTLTKSKRPKQAATCLDKRNIICYCYNKESYILKFCLQAEVPSKTVEY
jgi:hypothetical protein